MTGVTHFAASSAKRTPGGSHMSRRLRSALILLLLAPSLLLGAVPGHAAGDVNVFVAAAQAEGSKYPTQVRMAVAVTNARGEPVKGLDKSAFAVSEAGRGVTVDSATLASGDQAAG